MGKPAPQQKAAVGVTERSLPKKGYFLTAQGDGTGVYGPGDGGIQFNSGTYGPLNVGDWLDVETTGTGGTFNEGIQLAAFGGNILLYGTQGIFLQTAGTGDIDITQSGTGALRLEQQSGASLIHLLCSIAGDRIVLQTTTGEIRFTTVGSGGGGDVISATNNANAVRVQDTPGGKLGFFGTTPVVKQAAITNPTGGVVIDSESRTAITAINALLRSYGLET